MGISKDMGLESRIVNDLISVCAAKKPPRAAGWEGDPREECAARLHS
jgi:hypothetical protein